MIDKQAFKQAILDQDKPFTIKEISEITGVNVGSTNLMFKEMKLHPNHQVGRSVYYSVSEPTKPFYKVKTNPAPVSIGSRIKKNISNAPFVNDMTKNIMSLSPAERFVEMANLTDMVIDGISPSLLITGMAGIGKTYMVKERLKLNDKVEGEDFHILSGTSTPMGLYTFLHDHRKDTIIFDDCDSVFDEVPAVNILKAALDSYETRRVCWCSTRLPEGLDGQFDFEGQIIFISNRNAARLDPAVLSRSMVIDIQLTRPEVCEHLRGLIEVIEPKMNLDMKKETLEYLSEISGKLGEFNLRTFIKACRIRKNAEVRGTDWKKTIMVLN